MKFTPTSSRKPLIERIFNAIKSGDIENLKFCLERYVNNTNKKMKNILNQNHLFNEGDNTYCCSLLRWAMRHGQLPVLEYLYEIGADLDYADIKNRTLLYYATYYDNKKMIS